jgi:hypothetical protein
MGSQQKSKKALTNNVKPRRGNILLILELYLLLPCPLSMGLR